MRFKMLLMFANTKPTTPAHPWSKPTTLAHFSSKPTKPAHPTVPPTKPAPPTEPPVPERVPEKIESVTEIYNKTQLIVVVNEDNFETSLRIGEAIGGFANIWATSKHPMGSNEVKSKGAASNVKILKEGQAKVTYQFDPLSIATNKWLRGDAFKGLFDRVVYYTPPRSYDVLGDFLQEAKQVLARGGQIHLFDRPKSPNGPPHHNWPLEKLAIEKGLVCTKELSLPWGGAKGGNPYSVLVFDLPPPGRR